MIYSFRSKSMPFSVSAGFLTNPCIMYGIQSIALCPSTSGTVGTTRHPRNSSPSFSTMISNIFLLWFLFNSSCGKKNIPTPYSRSFGSTIPASLQAFTKNLWLICNKIPTPSPVLPSASLPARCSRFSTMLNASDTVLCVFLPFISTIAPIPQLSCSNEDRYKAGCGRSFFVSNIIVLLSVTLIYKINLYLLLSLSLNSCFAFACIH